MSRGLYFDKKTRDGTPPLSWDEVRPLLPTPVYDVDPTAVDANNTPEIRLKG